MRDAIERRLADELGDRTIARRVVERLGDDGLARLIDAIRLDGRAGHAGAETSWLLDFRPAVGSFDQVDAVVVFAFGNRPGATHDEPLPGPVNEALAELADRAVVEFGCTVFAQWEVADRMSSPAVSIGRVRRADGSWEYLSTIGVADQVVTESASMGRSIRRVGVIAFADHAARCCRVLVERGLDAVVAPSLTLPSVYDDASGQSWTRDRASYVAADLAARLAMASTRRPAVSP